MINSEKSLGANTEMQKAADVYSICAGLSKANFVVQCTDRNRNREHCAVSSVLITLLSKHRSDSRVLLKIYQHNNLIILHHYWEPIY